MIIPNGWKGVPQQLLASGVRTGTQDLGFKVGELPYVAAGAALAIGQSVDSPTVLGLHAFLNVTVVPGIDTVLLTLEGLDPVSGAVYTVASTLAQVATGLVQLKCFPGIAVVAPSATNVVVNDVLPAIWRLRVVHSAAGAFTYSLSVALGND